MKTRSTSRPCSFWARCTRRSRSTATVSIKTAALATCCRCFWCACSSSSRPRPGQPRSFVSSRYVPQSAFADHNGNLFRGSLVVLGMSACKSSRDPPDINNGVYTTTAYAATQYSVEQIKSKGNCKLTLSPGWASASSSFVLCNHATARTRLRPRPFPGVVRLVPRRTKRSSTFSRMSAGMPSPLSLTTTSMTSCLCLALS
jgi:hypothetical protein